MPTQLLSNPPKEADRKGPHLGQPSFVPGTGVERMSSVARTEASEARGLVRHIARSSGSDAHIVGQEHEKPPGQRGPVAALWAVHPRVLQAPWGDSVSRSRNAVADVNRMGRCSRPCTTGTQPVGVDVEDITC